MENYSKNNDLHENLISFNESILTEKELLFENLEITVPILKKFRTIISTPTQSKKKPNNKMNYSSYFRLLSYTKPHCLLLISGLIFSFLSQLRGIFLPYISGMILDVIITTRDLNSLNQYCIIFIGIFSLGSFAIFARLICTQLLSERVSIDLKNECFEKFISYDIDFFDKRKTGELLSRLGSDIATLRMAIGANVSQFFRSLFLCISCFVIMFILSWRLALIISALVPIFMVFTTVFSQYLKQMTKKFQDLAADSSVIAEECFSNIRTVKSFSTEFQEAAHFKSTMLEAYNTIYKRSFATGMYYSLTDMVSSIGTLAVLWYGGYHVLEGDMTSGELVAFLIYSNTYASTTSLISDSLTNIVVASGVAEILFDLIDYKPNIKNGNKKDFSDFEGRITFNEACFSYPSKINVKTIDHLNLEILPGDTIALCGSSGGGKSTIISLIERFYDLTEGSLLINRIDIKDYDLRALHQHIGYVAQEPILFSGTIEENITYGVESYTLKEMYDVTKLANAFDFITDKASFPDGFKTLVGERGTKLSGGQKQRVAIARALIKKPKILIFDESTSALDADSEHQVQISIDNLIKKGDMTVIIIAHRLSTIMNCKRIIVLSGGKIVEEGDHESLVQKNGVYKNLIEKQMK